MSVIFPMEQFYSHSIWWRFLVAFFISFSSLLHRSDRSVLFKEDMCGSVLPGFHLLASVFRSVIIHIFIYVSKNDIKKMKKEKQQWMGTVTKGRQHPPHQSPSIFRFDIDCAWFMTSERCMWWLGWLCRLPIVGHTTMCTYDIWSFPNESLMS